MRAFILAFVILTFGSIFAGAANNILISQPNGTFAVLKTAESGGVHTITVVCQ